MRPPRLSDHDLIELFKTLTIVALNIADLAEHALGNLFHRNRTTKGADSSGSSWYVLDNRVHDNSTVEESIVDLPEYALSTLLHRNKLIKVADNSGSSWHVLDNRVHHNSRVEEDIVEMPEHVLDNQFLCNRTYSTSRPIQLLVSSPSPGPHSGPYAAVRANPMVSILPEAWSAQRTLRGLGTSFVRDDMASPRPPPGAMPSRA